MIASASTRAKSRDNAAHSINPGIEMAGIRAKVIGLVRHGNRLLVCEVLDDEGILTGRCPLGGGIEFGETVEAALRREIREELKCDIVVTGPQRVLENIYQRCGVPGHEIVFAIPISLSDPEIYLKDRFQIPETDRSLHYVEWIDLERFRSGAEKLFPVGLTLN